ncbi:MAG: alpha-L-fucosidase [Planctomycetota bacterium]
MRRRRWRDCIPQGEYEALAQEFQPAADWAGRLAQRAVDAGARYMVLTARHHDGYCLFDTRTHDFNAVRTGPGRDLVAEFVQACRAAGLGIGLYYSVHTWRWRGFWDPQGCPEDLPAMVAEMHTQVEELMTGYGAIDLLWYDGPAVPGSWVPGHFVPATTRIDQEPAAFYRSAALNARVRKLQPQILINDRSGLPEDFGTPEQHVRADEAGRPWEACMTTNYAPGWGYLPGAMANKTPGTVLWHLVDAVRQGGNFLFNVGPRGDGSVDDREGHILDALGDWLRRHGEAIHGTRPGRIYAGSPGQGPCFHYGMFTGSGARVFLTLFYYPGTELIISRLQPGIRSARIHGSDVPLQVEAIRNRCWRISGLPERSPDPLATVLEIVFEDVPGPIGLSDASWLDGAW